MGGLKVSNSDDSFTIADNLPTNWTLMEFRVPVRNGTDAVKWVTARVDRELGEEAIKKRVSVKGNPFSTLLIQPWADGAEVSSKAPGDAGVRDGHVEWVFEGSEAVEAEVELTLDYAAREGWDGGVDWDGSLEAEGMTRKFRDYSACQPSCLGSP